MQCDVYFHFNTIEKNTYNIMSENETFHITAVAVMSTVYQCAKRYAYIIH